MTHLEHADLIETQPVDPIEAIIALAQECRAEAIADDARRMNVRLESARLHVSVVGSASVLRQMMERITRHAVGPASGVVYGFGNLDGHSQSHRVDVVLVDEQDAQDAKLDKWHGMQILVLDTSRSDEIDRAFAAIERMAVEAGATKVDSYVAQHARNLCLRLQNHLYEHQRALSRATQDLEVRINALTIARVLAETAPSREPDPGRDQLVGWLGVERTKFLMATKVDALVRFDERLRARNRPLHQLRRDAAEVAAEIVDDQLASLWERLRTASDPPLATHTQKLLGSLETSLGDLGEAVPNDAMAGVHLTPLRGFARASRWTAPSGVIAHLADRVRLASRRRIEGIGRTEVVTRLEVASQQLVANVLDDYDETRDAIERRFYELLDGARESARVAAENAKQAQSEGADGVARARSRIDRWITALLTIRARVQ